MLRIGLARIGKKKQAHFRIVVQEKQRDTFGVAREIVGSVNPHTDPRTIQLKEDRIKYWLSVGAQPTATVHNLLIDARILTGGKLRTLPAYPKKEEAPVAAAPAEKKPTEAKTPADAQPKA